MGSADILKGVGLHRADALAINLDVGDSIALIRGDGKGLIFALADADIAGGRNGAASPGSCLDSVVAVVPIVPNAISGDLGVLGLTGGSGRFNHEHEGGAGNVVVVLVPRLGCNDAHRCV